MRFLAAETARRISLPQNPADFMRSLKPRFEKRKGAGGTRPFSSEKIICLTVAKSLLDLHAAAGDLYQSSTVTVSIESELPVNLIV